MNSLINLYIAGRFREYERPIQNLLVTQYEVASYITDARCRPWRGQPSAAPLAIILLEEPDNDRESPAQWLTWVTESIRENSERVFVLLFTDDTGKHLATYNNIDSKMQVDCLRQTIDDDFNLTRIKEKISSYLNLM